MTSLSILNCHPNSQSLFGLYSWWLTDYSLPRYFNAINILSFIHIDWNRFRFNIVFIWRLTRLKYDPITNVELPQSQFWIYWTLPKNKRYSIKDLASFSHKNLSEVIQSMISLHYMHRYIAKKIKLYFYRPRYRVFLS